MKRTEVMMAIKSRDTAPEPIVRKRVHTLAFVLGFIGETSPVSLI
ncbi:hypothetical protein EQ832_25480 [Pseudomonas sp. ALS1131]|nr:hypothetical protein EQ832_25480 [Pseudomonas sp. ALS1131]